MSTNIPPLFQQGEWVDLTYVEALRQVKAPFFYGRFGGAASLAAWHLQKSWLKSIYSTTQKVMNSESSLL